MVQLSRRASLLSVCAVLVMAAVWPAAAQFMPRVDFGPDGADGVVAVNGRVAIRFKSANATLSRLQRAQITAGRLKPLANGGWKSIAVRSLGRHRAQVMAGDQLICIATEGDARANGTSALALAQAWARNLRWLFSMPPISVVPSAITVPENETRAAGVGGAAMGPIRTVDGDPSIAISTVDPASRAVVVTGKSVGRSTVTVSCQGCETTLAVEVKKYAAKLARTEVAEVTGNPAPDRILERAAAHAAPNAVVIEPGATANFTKPKVLVASLPGGESTRVLVPVRATGQGYIPVDLLAPVDVFNRLISHRPPTSLFYSNNPERVTRYQTLFTGMLELSEPVRLLYHHQNMIGKRAWFTIELINSGTVPASILGVSGVTSPIVDTVVVGYLAGMSFMRDYLKDVGQVYRIPPRSKLVIYAASLGHIKTASGIIDLRQLSGDDVFVRVAAEPPAGGQLKEGQIAEINNAQVPSRLSGEVFTAPEKQIEADYVVGDRWTFIRIGKHAIRNASQERELFGNYGVIYRVKMHLENPSADQRTIRILFEPTAGPAGAIFVFGGKIIGVKIVVPPNEFEIGTVQLAPGQSRDVTILTMPLSGSAYPATMVVRG